MLKLPDNCAVRLIDLEPSVNGLLSVDEDGFVNIYLNARLSRDAQLKALRHELRHYCRGDLYSDADIREVERLADNPVVLAMDGTPLSDIAPAFDPEKLRAVGRGLYKPTGENAARAAADLNRVRAVLPEACRVYDVMQPPPCLEVSRLATLAEGLCPEDIAFIAWQPPGSAMAVSLRFCREAGDRLHGAIFYDARGKLDNALAVFEMDGRRIDVDLRLRAGKLEVFGIAQDRDGVIARIY